MLTEVREEQCGKLYPLLQHLAIQDAGREYLQSEDARTLCRAKHYEARLYGYVKDEGSPYHMRYVWLLPYTGQLVVVLKPRIDIKPLVDALTGQED